MSSSKHPAMEVKVGILTTIARSIYSDTLMKIREAVSNSADNKASRFAFTLNQKTQKGPYSLSLFDNGHGMTEAGIEERLQSIGYGLYRDDPHAKEFYSYFGLGLMSIFQLGQHVTVITKSKEDSKVVKLTIDSKRMFSKAMESKHLSALKHLVVLDASSEKERDTISPLSKGMMNKMFKDSPRHFTDIVIDNVNKADLESIMDAGFVNRLRQILPLKVEKDDPFLGALEENDKKKLLKFLEDDEFCPTIDVLLSLDGTQYELLKKYFPDFPNPFHRMNYRLETMKDKDFKCYFLASGKDLGVRDGHDRETGFWVRNINFLVKAADFMSHQGMTPLIGRAPLKNWIFGEVFHQNMHEFLEPSRKEYIISDYQYKDFRERLRKKLVPFVKEMEKAYDAYQAIIKEVKTPYDTLTREDEKSPFRKLETNLTRIEGIKVEDVIGEKADEVFGKLGNLRNLALERCLELTALIKSKVFIRGVIGKEESYVIIVDPGAEDESIKYDHTRQLAKAIIPAKTFERKRITLFGRSLVIIFVYCDKITDAISFNMEEMAIYVNVANKELKNHSISFLDVLIAAEYAYHYSADSVRCQDATTLDCLEEMKETILHFLGEEYEQLSGFMDDLGSYFKGSR